MLTVYLCGFALLAGFIDAIAGGGGLIQLPALLALLPLVPTPLLLGTNKLAALAGTSAAAAAYSRRVPINWRQTLPAALAAGLGALAGARVVTVVGTASFRPVVLALLVAVAAYTFRQKDFGAVPVARPNDRRQLVLLVVIGGGIGFYDGFFGPGTGSFLLFLCIKLLGFDFLRASATAKLLNVVTNVTALVFFVLSGDIIFAYALPMALCNVAGSAIGARLAIRRGSRFVRVLFLVIVTALILKIAYDTLQLAGLLG